LHNLRGEGNYGDEPGKFQVGAEQKKGHKTADELGGQKGRGKPRKMCRGVKKKSKDGEDLMKRWRGGVGLMGQDGNFSNGNGGDEKKKGESKKDHGRGLEAQNVGPKGWG